MTDTTQGNAMTSTPVAPQQESATTGDGRGPSGMWWVAWRQHRFAVLASLTLMAIAALALVTFRMVFSARMDALGGEELFQLCRSGAPEEYDQRCRVMLEGRGSLDYFWIVVRAGLIPLPGVVGVLLGAVVFARERERGTHVFALTQSVSRTRWFWIKCAVVMVPLIAGMVAVGLLTEWAAAIYGPEEWPVLETPAFQLFGFLPAILTMLILGVSLAVGSLIRSTLPAVVVALGLSVAVAGSVGYLAHLDLVPHDRIVAASAVDTYYYPVPVGALRLEEGWLGADGKSRTLTGCPEPGGLDWENDPEGAASASDRAFDACLEAQGITGRYTAYVDISQRPRLTLTLAGISFLLAGASLTFGSWRLRRRPL